MLFIPLLLMGKATSDVGLFLGEWDRRKKVPSHEHRVSSGVARVGVVQELTAQAELKPQDHYLLSTDIRLTRIGGSRNHGDVWNSIESYHVYLHIFDNCLCAQF